MNQTTVNQPKTRPTSLKEHNFPIESFIAGWYIPEKICDDLVNHFESNRDKQYQGTVNANPNDTEFKKTAEEIEVAEGTRIRQVEYESKKSIDMGFEPAKHEKDAEILDEYFKYLNLVIQEYEFKYPNVKQLAHYGTTEGLNIQKYNPGDGFYEWHQERNGQSTMTRCLVHMTYLNDVDDGGTEFWFQKLTSPAKKGLTLIWPSDWTHLHRGQISKTNTKYILTGWLNYRE